MAGIRPCPYPIASGSVCLKMLTRPRNALNMKKTKVLRKLILKCTAGNCPDRIRFEYFSDKTFEIDGVNIGTRDDEALKRIIAFFFYFTVEKKTHNKNGR